MFADLRVKIFADGASLAEIKELHGHSWIRGFTTNPTLMRKDGVMEYASFAAELIRLVPDRPLSFEVIGDDFKEMERQAELIAAWGENVYVKIPVMNTKGEPSYSLLRRLAAKGIKQNVTAIMTQKQIHLVTEAIMEGPSAYISVFAGRIADTGRDPVPMMRETVEFLRPTPHLELLWASPREILNVKQADDVGCHIITVTGDVLKKISSWGRDLDDFSRATVQMFYDDAQAAGYSL